jgi:hypothetical protein
MVQAAGVVWSCWFLAEALPRFRFDRMCAMICEAFTSPEGVAAMRHAMDWQTPLILAGLPLLPWAGQRLLRRMQVSI